MKITYDVKKREQNLEKHKVNFDDIDYFYWATALIHEDKLKDYGESRYIALGFIHGRLHVLVYVLRMHIMRIISLRKANAREVAAYHGKR